MRTTNRPLYERVTRLKRKFRPENKMARGLCEAGPLVDVALLLYLFFIVNSTFVIQPGIILNLPKSAFLAGAHYETTIVTISQEGMIFFNDERTTMEGLDAGFAQAVHEDPETRLIIEADNRVEHGTLVEIYNKATEAGIRQITLGTRISSGGRAP